ncbi:MAG: hypothetical protein QG657_5708 [Acidobacteriota bacterium]|nr:hypothetical protein [Acidobacteriota bacterium]
MGKGIGVTYDKDTEINNNYVDYIMDAINDRVCAGNIHCRREW